MAEAGSIVVFVTIKSASGTSTYQGDFGWVPVCRGFGEYEPAVPAKESEAERLTRIMRECATS